MGFYGRRLIPNPLLKELLDKRYTHYVTLTSSQCNFVIEIRNSSPKDLTSDDIKNFINSLPDGITYPVITTKLALNGEQLNFITGIKKDGSTNKIVFTSLLAVVVDNQIDISEHTSSVLGDYTIVSQYVF